MLKVNDTPLRKVRMHAGGETFTLTTWDCEQLYRGGPQQQIAYCLTDSAGVVFVGRDFGCSPLDAIDSDVCLRSLMSFLSLRPGDTDREYFERYTARQMDFAERYGEELSGYGMEDCGMSFEEVTP